MSEGVIKAEGLTKLFNKSLVAVDHVNFSVEEGEIFGFLGAGGAGKTTTINVLITLLKPSVFVGAFAFSLIVSVVFAIYTAWRASRLKQVEALRYE